MTRPKLAPAGLPWWTPEEARSRECRMCLARPSEPCVDLRFSSVHDGVRVFYEREPITTVHVQRQYPKRAES